MLVCWGLPAWQIKPAASDTVTVDLWYSSHYAMCLWGWARRRTWIAACTQPGLLGEGAAACGMPWSSTPGH